jgi:hypothetical protein
MGGTVRRRIRRGRIRRGRLIPQKDWGASPIWFKNSDEKKEKKSKRNVPLTHKTTRKTMMGPLPEDNRTTMRRGMAMNSIDSEEQDEEEKSYERKFIFESHIEASTSRFENRVQRSVVARTVQQEEGEKKKKRGRERERGYLTRVNEETR